MDKGVCEVVLVQTAEVARDCNRLSEGFVPKKVRQDDSKPFN